jgi:predicted nucleic acid-binding protein
VIFIDANVPMYVVGAAHPTKDRARLAVERVVIENAALSARDAIHVAVMQRYGIARVIGFDRALDSVTGVDHGIGAIDL